jgi:hypothetical protein
MYQGTKTRKPRRLKTEGTTTLYRRRKPTLLARLAFGVWTVMARTVEYVAVLALLLAFALACLIVPLLIWF